MEAKRADNEARVVSRSYLSSTNTQKALIGEDLKSSVMLK